MKLKDCPKHTLFCVSSINILDAKLKLRLHEIGLFKGSKIQLLNSSFLKNTMLIQVLDSCFAIKADVANNIEVEYV